MEQQEISRLPDGGAAAGERHQQFTWHPLQNQALHRFMGGGRVHSTGGGYHGNCKEAIASKSAAGEQSTRHKNVCEHVVSGKTAPGGALADRSGERRLALPG
eukprot:7016783-Ditylum_brightwellii.AAC.1